MRGTRAGRIAGATAGIALATALLAPASTATASRLAASDVPVPVALCSSTPFTSGDGTWYRIPAVVRTPSGALLAFAERRESKDPSSDTGTAQVVEARSTDAGCSWSAPKVVASNGRDTVGNPSPVVTKDGRVLLFSIDRAPNGGSSFHGLHMQTSSDDGVTFSDYSASSLDLGTLLRPVWHGGLTGPGHALLLASGRIVVPMFFYDDGTKDFGASDIYSDDSGATWNVGYAQEGEDGRMEGTVAQLADGDLWLSYHSHDSNAAVGKGRIVATSSTGGASLTSAFSTLKLPVISVEASSLVVQGGPYAGELLVSSPGRKDVTRRQLMTIFVGHGVSAKDPSGSYWSSYPVGLDDTPASYSDLVQVDDQTVGVLYETGHESWHEKIAFTSMRIAALTAGATVPAKASLKAPKSVWHGHVVVHAIVAVPGTKSPAGSVTVTISKKGWSRSQVLPLAHDTSSQRTAVFENVPKGKYSIRVRYTGTLRIKAATSSTATLTVKG